jgi:hypothetical protein
MPTRPRFRVILLQFAALCAALPSLPAVAADPADTTIEKQARTELQAMSEYLRASKSLSFHADVQFDDVLPSGQKIAFAAEADIALRRPNGIHAVQVSDTGAKRLWFDGKAITLYDPGKQTMGVENFSGNTDKALDHMMNVLHFNPPLADLLYEDPAKALLKNAVHGFVVGNSPVQGTVCRHLAFVDRQIDWQIWIENGKMPLPRKLLITYKTLPGSPQYSATLSDWDFATRLPDRLFQPDVPAGAVRIPFLKEEQAHAPAAAGISH